MRGGGWGERKQSHMKLDEKISITHCNSIQDLGLPFKSVLDYSVFFLFIIIFLLKLTAWATVLSFASVVL